MKDEIIEEYAKLVASDRQANANRQAIKARVEQMQNVIIGFLVGDKRRSSGPVSMVTTYHAVNKGGDRLATVRACVEAKRYDLLKLDNEYATAEIYKLRERRHAGEDVNNEFASIEVLLDIDERIKLKVKD